MMRLIFLCLIPLGGHSQNDQTLSIGDSMPLITFKEIFNKSGTSISLSDYKGKLIIFDFWNKWCPSCIEAFPKMEKLQEEFGDRIKILLITNDTNKDLIKLFKKIKQPALPILSDDSILCRMFPHATVPHHVWINPDGRIQFITDGYNATSQNVSKILDGKDVKLNVKKEATDVDKNSELWKEGNGRLQKFIHSYSFAMTKLNEIIDATYCKYIKDTVNNTCYFKFVNIPILNFYKIAFGGNIVFTSSEFTYNNRIQFKFPEGDKFFKYPDDTDSIPGWEERNLVCYEAKWRVGNDSLAYQYLQNDANKFFPFSVKVEATEVHCYVLKKLNHLSDTKFKNKENSIKYTDSSYSLKNMPPLVLVKSLNNLALFRKLPVVDETNYTANIDIYLLNAFKDIVELKKQLLARGLALEEGRRRIKMLVIGPK